MSSSVRVARVDTTSRASSAPAAIATSPSGCSSDSNAIGATPTGLGSRVPNSVTDGSTCGTARSTAGANR